MLVHYNILIVEIDVEKDVAAWYFMANERRWLTNFWLVGVRICLLEADSFVPSLVKVAKADVME